MEENLQKIIDAFKNNESAGKYISLAVNRFGFPVKEYAYILHDNAHYDFLQLCYAWISYLDFAYGIKWLVDPRNETAAKTAHTLVSLIPVLSERCGTLTEKSKHSEKFGYTSALKKGIRETCDYMRNDHKTLQQTFSSLIFFYLKTYDKDVNKEIEKMIKTGVLYEGFWKMPMI